MSGLIVERLSKRYSNYFAVRDVDLSIAEGQFCVFLGPSGCGKSTTLNCIAGLEEATSGRILLNGKDITRLAPHQRDIAMVFQSALLYPHLTARANISMSLRKAPISKEEADRRVARAIDMLKIDALLDKRPAAMSGGERQRIAMAKAIVRQPAAFLLDEPLSALDAALRHSLRTDLVRLQKQLGVTTVFVTHDQVEAMTMGDVIVVMNKGRVEQVGSPQEIYEQPKTRFVAGFVGAPPMNFFRGTIESGGQAPRFVYAKRSIMLTADLAARVGAVNAELGIRPQDVALSTVEVADAIPGEVYAVERLGKENIVVLRDEIGETFRALVPPSAPHAIGDRLFLQPNGARGHIFAA
jgi:ABC-type sugar transport system ATPase subunit